MPKTPESKKTTRILRDHRAVTKEGENVTQEAKYALASIREVLEGLRKIEIDLALLLQKKDEKNL